MNPSTDDISTPEEAAAEIENIKARAAQIQEETTKLQNEFSQLNLRVAFLQGIISAQSRQPAATPVKARTKTAKKK